VEAVIPSPDPELEGAAAFPAVRSYLSTARKHRMNPLTVLRQLFEGHSWFPVSAGWC
jgi:hypothetical protein